MNVEGEGLRLDGGEDGGEDAVHNYGALFRYRGKSTLLQNTSLIIIIILQKRLDLTTRSAPNPLLSALGLAWSGSRRA